jgi:hypothetical protein
MPTSLIVYMLAVLACDLALIGWELAATPPRAADLLLFGALPSRTRYSPAPPPNGPG